MELHFSDGTHFCKLGELLIKIVIIGLGAMAGSTAGGIKESRIVIALKGTYIHIRKLINPRYVPKAKFEGKTLETKTVDDVFAFITLYFFLFLAVLILFNKRTWKKI